MKLLLHQVVTAPSAETFSVLATICSQKKGIGFKEAVTIVFGVDLPFAWRRRTSLWIYTAPDLCVSSSVARAL